MSDIANPTTTPAEDRKEPTKAEDMFLPGNKTDYLKESGAQSMRDNFDKENARILNPKFGLEQDPRKGGPADIPGGLNQYIDDRTKINTQLLIKKLSEALDEFDKADGKTRKLDSSTVILKTLEMENNKGVQGSVLLKSMDESMDAAQQEVFKGRLKNALDYYDSQTENPTSSYARYIENALSKAVSARNKNLVLSARTEDFSPMLLDYIKAPLSQQGDKKTNEQEFFKRLLSAGSPVLDSPENKEKLFSNIDIGKLSLSASSKKALEVIKSENSDSSQLLGKALAIMMPASNASFESNVDYSKILPAFFAGVKSDSQVGFWQAYGDALKEQNKYAASDVVKVLSPRDLPTANDFFNRQLKNLPNRDLVIDSVAQSQRTAGVDELVGFVDFTVLKEMFNRATSKPSDYLAANIVAVALLHVENGRPQDLVQALNPNLQTVKSDNPTLANVFEMASTGDQVKLIAAIKELAIVNDSPELFRLVDNSIASGDDLKLIDSSFEDLMKRNGVKEVPKTNKQYIDQAKLLDIRLTDRYPDEASRQARINEFLN